MISYINGEDLQAHTYLEVINEAGVSRFDISLIEKQLVNPEDNVEVKQEGSNVGLIVGLCFVVAFGLLAIGLGIWYCKAKSLLCFHPKG